MNVCGFGDSKRTLLEFYQMIKSAQNYLSAGAWQSESVFSNENTESLLRVGGLAGFDEWAC